MDSVFEVRDPDATPGLPPTPQLHPKSYRGGTPHLLNVKPRDTKLKSNFKERKGQHLESKPCPSSRLRGRRR